VIHLEARFADHTESLGVYDTLDDALEAHPATPRGAEVVVSDMVPAPWYGDDVYYAGAALIRWKPT
jgi:hypothetical protein